MLGDSDILAFLNDGNVSDIDSEVIQFSFVFMTKKNFIYGKNIFYIMHMNYVI